MVFSVRLNDKETYKFKEDLNKTGMNPSKYVKDRIFSKAVSERTMAKMMGETAQVLAELNIELKNKDVTLSDSLCAKLDKEVTKYVCHKVDQ